MSEPSEPPREHDDAQRVDDDAERPASRGWRIAAMVLVVLAMVAVGALGSLLLAGSPEADADVRACIPVRDFTKDASGHASGDECPPEGATRTDGLVQRTEEGGFTMREIIDGKLGQTVELHVREPDRPYIDIAHAQTHAALGQPIRVYTQEIDGVESVVYMTDPPADFGEGS